MTKNTVLLLSVLFLYMLSSQVLASSSNLTSVKPGLVNKFCLSSKDCLIKKTSCSKCSPKLQAVNVKFRLSCVPFPVKDPCPELVHLVPIGVPFCRKNKCVMLTQKEAFESVFGNKTLDISAKKQREILSCPKKISAGYVLSPRNRTVLHPNNYLGFWGAISFIHCVYEKLPSKNKSTAVISVSYQNIGRLSPGSHGFPSYKYCDAASDEVAIENRLEIFDKDSIIRTEIRVSSESSVLVRSVKKVSEKIVAQIKKNNFALRCP